MDKQPINAHIAAYEETYKIAWAEAPPHVQKLWADAWRAAITQAIIVVETYRVSVGNSRSGESAAKWTMDNLREVRQELRDIGGYL